MTEPVSPQAKPCRNADCPTPAVFAVYAVGYPAAMAVAFDRHLGSVLLGDTKNPGSTERWDIRIGSWVR